MTTPRDSSKTKILYGPVATVFSSVNTGAWRTLRPVFDPGNCRPCAECQKYCPVDAVDVRKGAECVVTFELAYCKGCGICADVCPRHSISMVSERKFV